MKKETNDILNHIDLVFLKHKGLTNKKIATILNISIVKVDKYLAFYENLCKRSGVF